MGDKDMRDLQQQGSELVRQVSQAVSRIDFEGTAHSLGQAARGVARQLGLMGPAPSPYIVCDRSTGAVVRMVTGVLLLSTLVPALGIFAIVLLALGRAVLSIVFGLVIVVLAIGAVMLICQGVQRRRMTKALSRAAAALGGRQMVTLTDLAALTSTPVERLRPLVRGAIERGLIPRGHLDTPLGTETLYLTDAPWEADCAARDASLRQAAERASWEQTLSTEAHEVMDACSAFVSRVHAAVPRLGEGQVYLLLDGVATKVSNLSDFVARHPEVAPQLRHAVTYYLPTATQLVDAYVEIEGRASSPQSEATKAELRQAFTQFDAALGKLSEELIREQAWDLEGDLKVMSTMLAQDGLTEDGGIQA